MKKQNNPNTGIEITARDMAIYIRYIRDRDDLTLVQMSKKLQMSAPAVHYIEKIKSPTIREARIESILNNLGVDRRQFAKKLKEIKLGLNPLKELAETRDKLRDFVRFQLHVSGHTQTQLAQKMDVFPTILSGIMNGNVPLARKQTIDGILDIFKISTIELNYMNEIHSRGNVTLDICGNDKPLPNTSPKLHRKTPS